MLHYCQKFVKTSYKGMINITLGKKAELSGNFLYPKGTSVNVAKCQPSVTCEKGGISSLSRHFTLYMDKTQFWCGATCMQTDMLYDFLPAKPFLKKQLY